MTKSRRLLFDTGRVAKPLGTGEGKGTSPSDSERERQTLETLIQFVKFAKHLERVTALLGLRPETFGLKSAKYTQHEPPYSHQHP